MMEATTKNLAMANYRWLLPLYQGVATHSQGFSGSLCFKYAVDTGLAMCQVKARRENK